MGIFFYPLFQSIPTAQSNGNVDKNQTETSKHDLKIVLHWVIHSIIKAENKQEWKLKLLMCASQKLNEWNCTKSWTNGKLDEIEN